MAARPQPSWTRKRISPAARSMGHGLSSFAHGPVHSSVLRKATSRTEFHAAMPPCAATRESIIAAPRSRIACRSCGLRGSSERAEEHPAAAIAVTARTRVARAARRDERGIGDSGTLRGTASGRGRTGAEPAPGPPASYLSPLRREKPAKRRVRSSARCIIMGNGGTSVPLEAMTYSESLRLSEERRKMVAEQIVSRGVKDPLVLAAMRTVPRHEFVPAELKDSAYRDAPLPIGREQTISQPYIVALMTESLKLEGGEKVLEIGTGSGYQAAVLAEIAGTVHSVEFNEDICREA